MIYLLHGNNQELSRLALSDLIKNLPPCGGIGLGPKEFPVVGQTKEIINLDGESINLTELIQSLESLSLLSLDKIIVIENLFSRPVSKAKEELIKYLKTNPINTNLIFWERKLISGTVLRWLPKSWHLKLYKTSPIIFSLLDNLRPNNEFELLNTLSQCLKTDKPELIFYLIIQRMRDLMLALDLGAGGLKSSPWQINKLIKQSSKFTLNKLTFFYKKLLTIDFEIKTGVSLMPLSYQLDLLLMDV